ncbi:MAG: PAS domain S-box protein [Azonexus sp.]|jgi:PAS domain S-box-containing protein|nr:PAS domain S-box protein [Azonexus sp.]
MTSPRQLRKLLIAGLVCINILVVAFCSYFLHQSRLQYERTAEQLTQNIASAVDQNVSASVDRIDLALRTVADELERRLADKTFDDSAINAFLARHEERLPEVEALRVANAEGEVILGKGVVRSAHASWADRDYFIHHREKADDTLRMAKPRIGRVAKQYIVGFSRRYNYPDGSFGGVISAPIAVSHFAQLLSRFDLGSQGIVALRDAELGLIARFPAAPELPVGQVGNSAVSEQLLRLIESGVQTATYYAPASADGKARLLTFHRLAKAPMIVISGRTQDDYLAGWKRELYLTSAIALGFVVLSIASGIFLVQQLRKTEHREQELRRSVETRQRQHESLRRLNEIAALSHLPLAEQLVQALTVGARLYGLEFGIVSHVDGEIYRIVAHVSPADTLNDGQEFALGKTYCKITLDSGKVLAIDHMGESPFASHPCYDAFKLEAYIGAPVVVDGAIFGTVNFSSPSVFTRAFDETDREFIALLARWVGSALERDQAQQKLAASERQLQTIIETEPECVKILALDGTLLQMNRAGLAMIEADSPEQVIGNNVIGIVAPAYRDAFRNMNTLVSRGESAALTFEIVGLKGGHRWLETHAVPMRDNAGQITGLLGLTRDISERKRSEAELEQHRRHLEELVQQRTTALLETEARASHILQSSADGLYGIDADGLITFINPAACAMLGYSAEQVIGRHCHEMFHHRKADGSIYLKADCPSLGALQFGQTVRVDDEVYWHADGHPVPVMYSTHPMIKDGRTIGAVTSVVDMSTQRAAAEAREQALRAAENLARVRSEFLANMSHEIRTPLNGVLGFADIGYRNCEDAAKARNAFAKIQTSGQRLLGVINDVLDFSKIEAGKLTIEQTEVLIAEVVDHAVDLVRDRAETKGLVLQVEMAPDLPGLCLSDPLRLGQVLLNVLSNAIKFTEQGRVTLSVSRQPDWLCFRVSDSGIGMSQSQLADLFKPFQQADASATRRFGGTGLGLAISKRIVELMQGSIVVDSQPGQGTTVEFRLPLIPCTPSEATPPVGIEATPVDAKPLAGLTFLVAEDEEINRMILEDNLIDDGARVVVVDNGREAVERITRDGQGAFDFVLMDIQMPEMDGYEATRQIKAIAPDLPIIAQTAHAFNEEREKCLAAGMIGHLAKPIDPQALLELVREHWPARIPG